MVVPVSETVEWPLSAPAGRSIRAMPYVPTSVQDPLPDDCGAKQVLTDHALRVITPPVAHSQVITLIHHGAYGDHLSLALYLAIAVRPNPADRGLAGRSVTVLGSRPTPAEILIHIQTSSLRDSTER